MIQDTTEQVSNLPSWLPLLAYLFGGGGVVWAIWSKFGEAIKSAMNIKNEAKKESFMLDNDRLKAIQEAQEFDNNKIKALQAENEELFKNAIAQRKEIMEEVERLENINKELKVTVEQSMDTISLYKRYVRYRNEISNRNNIEYKPLEEWK